MLNISHNNDSLQVATAAATVAVSRTETIAALLQNTLPQGNVLEIARAAALLAAKRTSTLIPYCHSSSLSYLSISFKIVDLRVIINVELHAIAKTNIATEAMHAATVAALTIYDMLKTIDPEIVIESIQMRKAIDTKPDSIAHVGTLKSVVIACSTDVLTGKKAPRAAQEIQARLQRFGMLHIAYKVLPDEIATIQRHVLNEVAKKVDLIILTGGTGLTKRDLTPEAIAPLLEREVPGIAEAARSYGQQRSPYAMLSRSMAGMIAESLVLVLPGSSRGAAESMDALFPALFHVFKKPSGAGPK